VPSAEPVTKASVWAICILTMVSSLLDATALFFFLP
jgi:hypothetical protein